MTKFIKKVLSFSIVLYVFLYSTHTFLISELNGEDNYLPHGGFDYTLKEKEYPLLWLGNSRTYVHVNQFEINDGVENYSYSLCQDGGQADILSYKLKNYLEFNKTPRKINIQCDYTMANTEFHYHDIRVSQFQNWKFQNQLISTYSWINPVYFYLPLISFDLTTIIKIILRYKPNRIYNGYLEINEPFGYNTELDWNHKFDTLSFDLTKSDYLDSIVKTCVDAGIPEINFWTPPLSLSAERSYKYLPSLDSVRNYYSFKYKKNINMVDLRDTIVFNDSAFFYNHSHLNGNGVIELTKLIKANSETLLEVDF